MTAVFFVLRPSSGCATPIVCRLPITESIFLLVSNSFPYAPIPSRHPIISIPPAVTQVSYHALIFRYKKLLGRSHAFVRRST
jgi:hypothetical protein